MKMVRRTKAIDPRTVNEADEKYAALVQTLS